ncbi:MAG: translocation/assembly module TamB domain-containing protein [Nitrospirae bacterium]|nr:translocation/assembly module TamB domain-containing protein [Nitrospirota bacterium]
MTTLSCLVFLSGCDFARDALNRNLSEWFQQKIKPAIEADSGLKIEIGSISATAWPLCFDARSVKLYDPAGGATLAVERASACLDAAALISGKKVSISRISIDGVNLSGEYEAINNAVKSLKKQKFTREKPAGSAPAQEFEIRNPVISGLSFDIRHEAKGIHIATAVKINPLVERSGSGWAVLVDGAKLDVAMRDRPEFAASVSGRILIAPNGAATIERSVVEAMDSNAVVSGRIADGAAVLEIEKSAIKMKSIKRFLQLSGPGGGEFSVTGEIAVPAAGSPSAELDISGEGYIENLMEALGARPVVGGLVRADARLVHKAGSLSLSGGLETRNAVILGMDGANLKAEFEYGDKKLAFSKGRGAIMGGKVTDLLVALDFGEQRSYKVEADVAEAAADAVFKLAGWTKPGLSPGVLSGRFRLSGTMGGGVKAMLADGRISYQSHRVGETLPERITGIDASLLLSDGILTIVGAEVRCDCLDGDVAGRADMENRWIALDYSLHGGDIGCVIAGQSEWVGGAFRLDGRVDGTFNAPFVSGTLAVSKGGLHGINFDSTESLLHLSDKGLSIDRLIVRSGESMLEGSGIVEFQGGPYTFSRPKYRFSGKALRIDPNVVIETAGVSTGTIFDSAMFSGTFSGDIRIEGDSAGMTADVKAVSENGKVYGQPYDRLDLDMRISPEETRIRSLDARRNDSYIKASGTVAKDSVCLGFGDSEVNIADIAAAPPGMSGRIAFKSSCYSTKSGREGEGTIKISYAYYRKIYLGGGDIHLTMNGNDVSYEGLLLDGRCRVKGTAEISRTPAVRLNAQFDQAEYADVVLPMLKDVPDDISLAGRGWLDAEYSSGRLTARLRLDDIALRGYGKRLKLEKPVDAHADGRRLEFDTVTLSSEDGYFTLDGSLEIGRRFDLAAGGKLDLAAAQAFSADLRNVRGNAWLSAEMRGEWADPVLAGSVYIDSGSLGLRDLPGRLTGITGVIFMDGGKITSDSITAQLGGGVVDMSGWAVIGRAAPKAFHLDLRAGNVALKPLKDLSVQLDAMLRIDGDGQRRRMTGDIVFTNAVYRGRVNYKSWLTGPSGGETRQADKSWFGDTELNVRVTGKNRILVDNNLARVFLDADLYLGGTPASPGLMGRVQVESGSVFFRSHEFRVISGSADMIDPGRFNPIVNVSAETWAKGHLVRLSMEGPLNQLNMNLFSESNFTETDILALLSVGGVGKEVEGLAGDIGAAEAAAFLSGGLQDEMEEKITSITGFDRFQLDPHVDKTLGTMGPRMTVGKKLFFDKLFISYSTNIGTSESQAVKLEYSVMPGITVLGQRDELGGTGADVKFHFDFD